MCDGVQIYFQDRLVNLLFKQLNDPLKPKYPCTFYKNCFFFELRGTKVFYKVVRRSMKLDFDIIRMFQQRAKPPGNPFSDTDKTIYSMFLQVFKNRNIQFFIL